MPTNEHVQIFSGKKLILKGNYWVTRVGKCANCNVIEMLPDDLHCALCQNSKLSRTPN